jgi:uncharacterized protein YdhG (YjbR/CyaY superfamily)
MPTKSGTKVWTDEEKAAMAESARERKAQAKLGPEEAREAGENEIQEKIAELPAGEREIAARVHEIISAAAPTLVPRTYYGMPAYATEGKNGKVICFFQSPSKFKVRYATLGFQPDAQLDDGDMWAIAFAVTKLSPAVEKRITELVKKAAG